MWRKSFVIFGLALVNGCGSAPKVSPCLVRFESGGCFYAPLGSDEVLLRLFKDMDKNICFTPEEHQLIMEWIKRHGGKKATQALGDFESQVKLVMEKTDVLNSKPGL